MAGATEYLLDKSTFAHNLMHVRDNARHTGSLLSRITGCTFTSAPAQMHYPYDETSASDKFYTYQALLLTPFYGTSNSNYVLDVYGNTIVLGRPVRRVAVVGRGAQVVQALELRGLAAGTYACRLLVAGQPAGGMLKLSYLP